MSLEILIVTGQSGSGKSTAVRAFEDQGYYVVDNLPTALVAELIGVIEREGQHERLVLVFDVRNRRSLREGPTTIDELRKSHPVRMIYLEASENALIRRYSETRRLHPLDIGQGLRDALIEERDLLTPMREIADDTFDTTDLSPHQLKARLIESLQDFSAAANLRVEMMSFGFKHGVPLEADTVLDVRFLPNPYFEPALREGTGLDSSVQQFVLQHQEAQTFLERTTSLLDFLVPQYQAEGKRYFTLAIGCTGGRHRSVTLAIRLAQRLEELGVEVAVRHRDIQQGHRKGRV